MVKTIQVSDETHEELTKIGLKNESYDAIIKRLLKFFKEVNYHV